MPTPPLSAAKRQKVEVMLRAGKATHEAIGSKCGVSTGTVHNIAAELGLDGKAQKTATATRKKVHEEIKNNGGTFAEIGKRVGKSPETARKYARMPEPKAPPKPSELLLPEPIAHLYRPHSVNEPGHWLVLSDVHLPAHDRATVEAAVGQAKRDNVAGVLINGDLLDCHEISSHDKDPSAPRYVHEIQMGRQFFAWLRQQLPDARIIYKLGNHEERLNRYVFARAPALFGLEGIDIPGLLHTAEHGVELVTDKRVIQLGKLNVIHGHEYMGGGGVNPARWLYLRARSMAMCGHFHRTSEHHARDIAQKFEATWSVGCACHLSPAYAPLNEWNHGAAFVEIEKDGLTFGVRNMRMVSGKLV